MRGPLGPSCRLWLRIGAAGAAAPLLLVLPSSSSHSAARQAADDPLDQVIALALEPPELPAMAAGLIDSIGGRLAGSSAATRSEAWAAGWLRSFGFDSVWHEVVRIPVWRRGETSVGVVSPGALKHRRLSAIAYGYSPGLIADSVPVVDIGRGEAAFLDSLAEGAQGAALLTDILSPELIARAAELGAIALLRISFEPGRLAQARVAPTAEPPAPLAVLGLSREDGLWLRRQAPGGLSLGLRVVAETRPGSAVNVVGEWRGRDPSVADEAFLLGAHLDSWDLGDGAIDNGTGVLAVMSAARALAVSGMRPRRTVRVVFFAAEELGLLGSREYVRAHAESLGDVVAMMNLDMVGVPEGYGATGHPEADTVFARLVQQPQLKDWGLTAEVNHGGGPGSDHQPFLLAGVPTIYVRTSLPPETPRWYHNAGDTFDKIELLAVRRTAAAVVAAAWALADHPGRPLVHLTSEETMELVQRLGW